MAKDFGNVAVFSVETYTRSDNSVGYKVTALTEEENPRVCIFYKDASEGEPKKGDRYQMVLGINGKLQATVRFVRL